MKKLLSLALAMLMFSVLFCGCENADPQKDNSASAEVTTAPADEVDYDAVYSEILENTYSLIGSKSNITSAQEGQTGIIEAIAGLDNDMAFEVVGYSIEDITGDGVKELVIGAVCDNENSWFDEPDLFAVYTIANDKPWLLIDGWARNSYQLLDDGTFLYEGSGGAAYTNIGIFRVSQGGTALMCNEYYFTEPDENNANAIVVYYNTLGKPYSNQSEKTDKGLSDFSDIREGYKEKLVTLNLVPFSEYK